jgi:dual specificity protein kinase YAK1
MDQWQSYSNAPGAPRRYNSNAHPSQTHQLREYNGTGAAQPSAGYNYDQYQGGLNSGSIPQSLATPPSAVSQRDGNGDVAMQDAGDAYSGVKYPMRPHHQQHLSASGRAVSHSNPAEQSTAAQRYSPMETLSPAAPYTSSPQTSQTQYASRQSPTRPGSYSSPNSYYSNRPQAQQLPPITPYASNNESYPPSATAQLNMLFGNDPMSPRRPGPPTAQAGPGRGPVPEFTKVRSIADLQPKINAQPAFRRANPEGGFISVRVSPTSRGIADHST